MTVKDFRELRVYQLAFETAMSVFQISKSWPAEERFDLTNQIRRSSRSVCANISEAWRKRRYRRSFVSKLSDADTEAGEVSVWADFAFRCGYISEDVHRDLRERCDHICAQLVTMLNQSSRWCGDAE